MTDRDDLLRRVATANPVPADSALPDDLADSRPPIALLIDEGISADSQPKIRYPSRWRGPAIAIAAALVVAMAVAVPLFLGGGRGGVPTADTTPTTTPAVTTVPPPPASTVPPVPTTTMPVASDVLQRVGADVMQPVVGLFDMTQAGSRLVAVGFDPGEDFRQDGVIFVSDDGVTWTRLAESDPALTTGTVLIYGITEGGPGLIAVGMSCEDNAFPCESGPHPTVWTSADGTEWTRTPADPETFGENGAMMDVVATDHGIVATGSVQAIDADDEAWDVPVVWLSEDGSEWAQVWQGEPIASGNSYMPGINALVVGPDGLIIGVGTASDDLGEAVAAVWVSTDARTWERVEASSLAFDSLIDAKVVMLDVVWGSNGLVAVGSDGGSQAAIWQSPDGRSWTRVDTADQPFGTIGSLSSVAALETGFVTAGPDGFVDQSVGSVTLWTSPDGSTWDRVAAPHTGYSQAVVVTDGGVAVAGGMPEANDYHAAVWAGPLLDPDSPPPDPVAPTVGGEFLADRAVIGSTPEGVSCEEIASQGFSYAEALSYWIRYELTEDFDLDTDGTPCANAYSASEIDDVFGGPDALSGLLLERHPTGTFAATGPAVDAGLVCPEGTIDYTMNPDANTPGVLWRWEDLFTCDDGSGTFLLGVDEYIDIDGAMFGVWNVVSGTGDYETLGGGGFTDSVFDDFDASTGRLWIAGNKN